MSASEAAAGAAMAATASTYAWQVYVPWVECAGEEGHGDGDGDGEGDVVVELSFLAFAPIQLATRALPRPAAAAAVPAPVPPRTPVQQGKSCLFSMHPRELVERLRDTPLIVRVWHQQRRRRHTSELALLAETQLDLAFAVPHMTVPMPDATIGYKQGLLALYAPAAADDDATSHAQRQRVGTIALVLRLSSLGDALAPHLAPATTASTSAPLASAPPSSTPASQTPPPSAPPSAPSQPAQPPPLAAPRVPPSHDSLCNLPGALRATLAQIDNVLGPRAALASALAPVPSPSPSHSHSHLPIDPNAPALPPLFYTAPSASTHPHNDAPSARAAAGNLDAALASELRRMGLHARAHAAEPYQPPPLFFHHTPASTQSPPPPSSLASLLPTAELLDGTRMPAVLRDALHEFARDAPPGQHAQRSRVADVAPPSLVAESHLVLRPSQPPTAPIVAEQRPTIVEPQQPIVVDRRISSASGVEDRARSVIRQTEPSVALGMRETINAPARVRAEPREHRSDAHAEQHMPKHNQQRDASSSSSVTFASFDQLIDQTRVTLPSMSHDAFVRAVHDIRSQAMLRQAVTQRVATKLQQEQQQQQ